MKSLLAILTLIFILSSTLAWEDCPFGEIECEGLCGRFVDTDGNGICDHSEPAPEARIDETADVTATTSTTDAVLPEATATPITYSRRNYLLPEVVAFLSGLYVLSLGLVRSKRITFAEHKAIWNVALVLPFLVSCGLGIVLVLRISYGIVINLPIDILRLHVISGNALVVILLFHISWHLRYYKAILKL